MIHVFARVPVAGRTKTRLIPKLGAERAAQLSAAMAEDTLAVVRSTGIAWRIEYDGPADHPFLAGRPAVPQVGEDLGERLANALVGGGLAVGTDCPLLDASRLTAAHDAATQGGAPLALERAIDGGYTWIAVSASAVKRGVFCGIPWSTDQTARAQIDRALALRLGAMVYDTGAFDVDVPADLTRLTQRLKRNPAGAPHTRALLASWLKPSER